MIIKKQINLTPKKLSGLFTLAIILIIIIILSYVSLFLYKNFYQTITQTKEILILKQKVAIDTVDMDKFNLIINRLAAKIIPKKIKAVNSPFH